MSTSTTTNKNLTLITPGTEVGTWGPYINSTTSILDIALGGTFSVTMSSSNVTLTSANCEYQRILITGTLSANLQLIFPTGVGGAWIVTNATANSGGPWTVTGTTGSGTTATLTQGYSTFIYSDGVNIALANPSIIQSNTITNSQLVQAPFYTVKGVNQAPLVVTNASGTGSTVTLTFSGAYLITPGSIITVSGITPSGYNGVYSATASTSTTVSYSNSTTGVYVSGGTIASSQNISDIPIGTVSSFNSATPLNILTTDTPWNAAAFVTLTDASTITPDFSTGFNFQVTVAGNRTIANPTNTKPGQSGVILIVQDSTGGRTISFGSSFKFSNGTAPTLSTTANSTNALFYYVVNSSFIVANNLGGVA